MALVNPQSDFLPHCSLFVTYTQGFLANRKKKIDSQHISF